ncbi:hypothetical protein BHE74_00048477 [Ensete ventricosum]|nr:hypothetical protein BHE74_00048477 [Ensete ventricosum]
MRRKAIPRWIVNSLSPSLGVASSSWAAEREGGVGGIAEGKGGFIDDLSLTKPPTRLSCHLPGPVTMVKTGTLRRIAQSAGTSVRVDVLSRLGTHEFRHHVTVERVSADSTQNQERHETSAAFVRVVVRRDCKVRCFQQRDRSL